MRIRLSFIVAIAAVIMGCNSDPETPSVLDTPAQTDSIRPSESDTTTIQSDETGQLADFKNKTWTIQGVVIDQNGNSVREYDAASIWSSNGKYWNVDGHVSPEDRSSIWKNEGELANRPQFSAQKTTDGMFRLEITDRPRAPVFVVNTQRSQGGIALVDRTTSNQSVTVTLEPLVKVTAELYCPEANKTPGWGKANIYIVGGDNVYLTSCGTYQGRVSFQLPPGEYEISAKGDQPVSNMKILEAPSHLPLHAVYPRGKRFSVPADRKELNLGVLELNLPRDTGGAPFDTTKLLGEQAPELSFVDARGVSQDFKIQDLQGKWVLLDFWAIWCQPCVARSLPELNQFYLDNSDLRDRFEILAVCNTSTEKILSMNQYDEATEAVRKQFWDGSPLPFPVLIDGEGTTYKNYGVSSWPTLFLIDPDGRIVANGSLEMLGERLQEIRKTKE